MNHDDRRALANALPGPDASLDLSSEPVRQPSLHVDESELRQAEAIFEREQEAMVAHAVAEDHEKRSAAMYVNEHGYVLPPPLCFTLLTSRQLPHAEPALRGAPGVGAGLADVPALRVVARVPGAAQVGGQVSGEAP